MKRIEEEQPNLECKWFWDFDFNKIDWQASYKTIIARIIERGDENHWTELTRFYGRDKVINALKNEIPYSVVRSLCQHGAHRRHRLRA